MERSSVRVIRNTAPVFGKGTAPSRTPRLIRSIRQFGASTPGVSLRHACGVAGLDQGRDPPTIGPGKARAIVSLTVQASSGRLAPRHPAEVD